LARYRPALLGSLFIGVISSLPVIGAFNACCCLWVVSGGVLTTYLMQQNDAAPLDTSVAALAGLIAGAAGGVVYSILTPLIGLVTGGTAAQREAMDQALGQMGDVPPEMVELVERLTSGPAAAFIGAAVTIPRCGVFGLLGGLLGLAFFRKKPGPTEAA
jgi:hypothetical protein